MSMTEMFLLVVILFIGLAFNEPVRELIYALADWIRSKIQRR
jgi:hypothetical protein